MQISSVQRKFLENYKRLHGNPPSTSGLLIANLTKSILLFMYLAVLTAIALAFDLPLFASFTIGLACGCFIILVSFTRITVAIWPVINAIVNWERVDELLAGRTEVTSREDSR